MGRRQKLGDAAIAVVSAAGLKGLTHRAVDTMAEVPAGTTSNYFRTRQALVDAVADRIEQRDLEVWAALGAPPETFEAFTHWLGAFARAMVVDHGELSRVRFSLFMADPDRYAPGHDRFLGSVAGALQLLGVEGSDVVAPAFLDYLDGVILHGTTVRPNAVPTAEVIAAYLARLAGP